MSTCPTTPYEDTINPFEQKENFYSELELCPHIKQENNYAILTEDYNLIFI